MTLERFLPIPEAAARLKIGEMHLRALLQSGKIRGGILPNGEIVVNEQDAKAKVPKEELQEYKKYAHLRGTSTWLSEAARRHNIAPQTLSKWVKAGFIKIVSREGNKVYLDEADVAYCAEIYHKRGGQGRWLFNPDGTPYKPKTVPLAQ